MVARQQPPGFASQRRPSPAQMQSEAFTTLGAVRRQQQQHGDYAPSPPPPIRAVGQAGGLHDAQLGRLRLTELVAFVPSVVFQVLLWKKTFATLVLQQHLHQAAIISAQLGVMGMIALMPYRTWLAYRVPILIGLRVAVVSVPSFRSMTVSAATLQASMCSSAALLKRQPPAIWHAGGRRHAAAPPRHPGATRSDTG